jgi:hypothetical protein
METISQLLLIPLTGYMPESESEVRARRPRYNISKYKKHKSQVPFTLSSTPPLDNGETEAITITIVIN